MCDEPHSSKIEEDVVSYALETDAVVQLAARAGAGFPASPPEAERFLRGIASPVLVVSGTEDRCQPQQRMDGVARLTGAEHLVLDGSGHLLMGRDPVVVNRAVRAFVDRVTGTPPPPRRWSRPSNRPQRLLYLSSPIGLGHARRDLAVAHELRTLRPGLQVEWLTQSPVAEFLAAQGETVHPASALLTSESGHVESESGEHDLPAFAAVRGMDEILVNNFMVFDDLVSREDFDLWLGDEAWDLDHFLHENPSLKRAPFVWMTDFVGWMPLPEGGAREAELTADWNAEMVEHVARSPRLRDRSVFVGDPADVVDVPLGPGLPTAREWTEQHFDFAGYVMGERPTAEGRQALRRRLGYGEDETVCVVSVGGSSVGGHLLRRVVAAYPEARSRIPGLRMVVVTGPRIDPASVDAPAGVDVRGFVPDLDLHHAACDVAVVQGGLTTTMELTASGRPFLYVPLRRHFEQRVHVRHRLERHGAGRCLEYDDADPATVADALVDLVKQEPAVPPGADRRGRPGRSAGRRGALSEQGVGPGPQRRPGRRGRSAQRQQQPAGVGGAAAVEQGPGDQQRAVRTTDPRRAGRALDRRGLLERLLQQGVVAGDQRERGQAAQPPRRGGVRSGGVESAPRDLPGLLGPPGLDQGRGQQPGRGREPPGVLDRGDPVQRPPAVPDRADEVPGEAVEPALVRLEVGGVGRVAAAPVVRDRLLDERPGTRPVLPRGRHERGLEHRPLQQPRRVPPAHAPARAPR